MKFIYLYRMKTFYITVLATALAGSVPVFAQKDNADDTTTARMIELKTRKFYIGSALDGGIFSTTVNSSAIGSTSTVRFTWFLNMGVTFNYDFSKHVGLYTGVDLKNIGFIEKINPVTIKRRTFNVGAPLGIKLGNLKTRKYLVLGGGIDFPINYREKTFITRNNKTKFNEWFSDRTPQTMPYVFVGGVRKGFSLKVQYYPTNYMNPDFTTTVGGVVTKPYAGYEVHPLLISLGMTMPYSKGPIYKNRMHMHHRKHKKSVDSDNSNVL